jgi:KaiC/GvpD/RAD55 family RecA-like ATPase
MHAPENAVILANLSHGVVEFRLFEEGFDLKLALRVGKMRGINVEQRFYPFTISDNELKVQAQ